MSLPQLIPNEDPTDAVAEIGSELHRALTGYMDWVVREWRNELAAVEQKQQGYVPPDERDNLAALRDFTRSAIASFERISKDPQRLDHLRLGDLDWRTIATEWARDEAAGRALWARVRQTAREELACGAAAGTVVEGYHVRAMERAQFLAVREGLADGLQPRNGMEWLLIDGMAEAWLMHWRWLKKHTNLDSLGAMHVERDMRDRGEWMPPRLSEAQTVDRAALMADRFQRQFLRLMKCYRDGRRLGLSMTVTGGQVNVAEQQINVTRTTPEFGEG